jgi:hypothetical protein
MREPRVAVQGAAANTIVIPAKAGIHIPETATRGTMGPRFRGDDTPEKRSRARLRRGLDAVVAHAYACGITGNKT